MRDAYFKFAKKTAAFIKTLNFMFVEQATIGESENITKDD